MNFKTYDFYFDFDVVETITAINLNDAVILVLARRIDGGLNLKINMVTCIEEKQNYTVIFNVTSLEV